VALVLSLIGTISWMILGNPYGIDNIYVAIFIPAAVILFDYAVNKSKKNKLPETEIENP
jgi:SSS family solute:Na+ symporter